MKLQKNLNGTRPKRLLLAGIPLLLAASGLMLSLTLPDRANAASENRSAMLELGGEEFRTEERLDAELDADAADPVPRVGSIGIQLQIGRAHV